MFIIVLTIYENYTKCYSSLLTIFSLTINRKLTIRSMQGSSTSSSTNKKCSICHDQQQMGAKICCCCRSDAEENEQLTSVILSRQPPPKEQCRGNLLVFINPHSGKGKSLETFAHTVGPKLDRNLIRYEVVVTTGPNHARNVLMTKTDLGKFNGVLILSGDGLVFEALNGILCREDAFRIFPHLPIGIVPSGSGNGLLCSVLSKYGTKMNEKSVMDRALEIATSPVAKAESVALYKVQTENTTYAAFLSIGWGLMADIDIESEKWRKSLGGHRFTVMGAIRSFNLRSYKGRLSYRLYKPKGFKPSSNVFNVYDKTTQQRIDDSTPPLTVPHLTSTESEDEKLETKSKNTWTLHDSDEMTSEDEEGEEVVIEDEFVNMYAVTLSHIASDGPFAPSAKLEDNRIHLSYILWKDIGTRVDIAKYLLAIEHETHLDLPFVKRVEVSSMKLDVLSDGSYVVLDGEVVETKSVTVSSTRDNICVFSSTA
ncbi:CRE-SPHK-1 protein [Caenorhabditis remanei]|uniref:CRE-SPHK-1 protein n=1 Tax=Caenorhabditis remanei TaxID=31234 RepID=E3LG95_CAERE|nr:CRE-SPHK-1 protein [Caenorhabditis remanei]